MAGEGICERKSETVLVGLGDGVLLFGVVESSVVIDERRDEVKEGGPVLLLGVDLDDAKGCVERILMTVRSVCRGRSGSQPSSHAGVGENEPRPGL